MRRRRITQVGPKSVGTFNTKTMNANRILDKLRRNVPLTGREMKILNKMVKKEVNHGN